MKSCVPLQSIKTMQKRVSVSFPALSWRLLSANGLKCHDASALDPLGQHRTKFRRKWSNRGLKASAIFGRYPLRVISFYIVRKPVHWRWKAVVDGMVELLLEVFDGVFFWKRQHECLSQVTNVVKWPQLWEASGQHHDKQVDQKRSLAAKYQKGSFTELFKPKTKGKINIIVTPLNSNTFSDWRRTCQLSRLKTH